MADNDWDSLIIQPGSTGPNRQDDWDNLIAPGSSLHGGQLDTAERREEQRDLEFRYQNMGGWRRGRAGVANFLSALPGVRHLGVENISNPADLDVSRRARPWLNFGERTLGHATPYALLPAPWMSTMPRSMLSAGVIEGTDSTMANRRAGIRGNQALMSDLNAAILGALSAAPGALINRAITPRTPVGRERVNTQARQDFRAIRAGNQPNLNYPPWSMFGSNNPSLENVVLSGAAGLAAGMHPAAYLAAGITPTIISRLRTAERRGALERVAGRDLERAFPGTSNLPPINQADRLIDRYLNTERLSPNNQALLNALGIGATQEVVPEFDFSRTLMGR